MSSPRIITPKKGYFTFPVPAELAHLHSFHAIYLAFLTWEGRDPSAVGLSSDSVARLYKTSGLFDKVQFYTPETAKENCCSKRKQSSAADILFSRDCSWCKAKTPHTHAHHFPIPACDGGLVTVDICANCHTEYHFLIRPQYRVKDWVGQALMEARGDYNDKH
jgi:hypothetical protein